MRLASLACAVGLIAATAGCSSILGLSRPQEESDGGGSGSAKDGDFTIRVTNAAPRVPQNGFDFLDVQIVRGDGFDGTVDVDLGPTPPNGVSAATITIAKGETVGHLRVDGDPSLTPGTTAELEVTGTAMGKAGKLTHIAEVTANITIKPGTIDPAFGVGGLASFAYDNRGNDLQDVSVGSDGSITAAGESDSALSSSGIIMRLGPDGAFDPAFNVGDASGLPAGTKKIHVSGSSAPSFFHGVSKHTAGPLIFLGQGHGATPAAQNPWVLSLQADGTVTTNFPAEDIQNVFDDGSEAIAGSAISGGSIVMLIRNGARTQSSLWRVTAAGKTDFGFGTGNLFALDIVTASHASFRVDLGDAQQPMYVVGSVLEGSGTTNDAQVVRVTQNAAFDPAWGTGGRATFGAAGVDEVPTALFVAANAVFVAGNANGEFFVAKLKKDGTVDTTFGTDGFANPPITDGDDAAADLVVQADGKIVVIGNANGGTTPGPIVARYNPDGTLDTTYGTNGVTPLFIGSLGHIAGIDLQASGNAIISGGHGDKDNTSAIVTRLGF